jgi:hypothetical protein
MKNVFKILARKESVKTDNLTKLLSPLGEVEVILDVEGDVEGHTGMTGKWRNSTTAWDILFKDLKEEYTWIIEDDVAFNKETIESVFNKFKFKEIDLISNWVSHRETCVCWCWWPLTKEFTDIRASQSWKSLNCFCRVSPNLINKTKSFIKKHKKGLFHEIVLPTLAETREDFRAEGFYNCFNTRYFNWSQSKVPLDNIKDGRVYHPVKSDDKHKEICRIK